MADLARDERKVPIPVLQPSTTQTVTITGTSALSTHVTATNIIRVVSTTDCHIEFGFNPVATTSSMFMPASVPEYFEIGDVSGDSTMTNLAVIQNSAGGTLYITEMI